MEISFHKSWIHIIHFVQFSSIILFAILTSTTFCFCLLNCGQVLFIFVRQFSISLGWRLSWRFSEASISHVCIACSDSSICCNRFHSVKHFFFFSNCVRKYLFHFFFSVCYEKKKMAHKANTHLPQRKFVFIYNGVYRKLYCFIVLFNISFCIVVQQFDLQLFGWREET